MLVHQDPHIRKRFPWFIIDGIFDSIKRHKVVELAFISIAAFAFVIVFAEIGIVNESTFFVAKFAFTIHIESTEPVHCVAAVITVSVFAPKTPNLTPPNLKKFKFQNTVVRTIFYSSDSMNGFYHSCSLTYVLFSLLLYAFKSNLLWYILEFLLTVFARWYLKIQKCSIFEEKNKTFNVNFAKYR